MVDASADVLRRPRGKVTSRIRVIDTDDDDENDYGMLIGVPSDVHMTKERR